MRGLSTKIFSLTILVCSLIILPLLNVSAQHFNIETFTTRDGLSHNDVRSISTDSSGFLWIATWDGLCRYDGYSFKNYYHYPDDSLSLPYFSITDVLVDGGNNIWIKTDAGSVARYDYTRDAFKRIELVEKNLPKLYTSISIDESGYLWLITVDRIFRYDFTRNRFVNYDLCDPSGIQGNILAAGQVYSISTAQKDRIWIVYDNIYEFERSAEDKIILKNEYRIESLSQLRNRDYNYIYWYKYYLSEAGNSWIFSNSGLYKLDKTSRMFKEYRDHLPLNEFKGPGFFSWSWHDKGLYLYNPAESELKHIPDDLCQLAGCISFQKKDIAWFSNRSMTGASLGLHRIVFTPDYFRDYPVIAGTNDVPAVYSIVKDSLGRIWAGTRGSNPVVLITPELNSDKLDIPEFEGVTNSGAVRSLTLDSNGLWIGYFKDILLFYDFSTGNFTRHETTSPGYRPIAINSRGKLYLTGARSGENILLYSPNNKKVEKDIPYGKGLTLYKLMIDSNGILWGGLNYSNLLRYDPVSDKTEIIKLSAGNYNIEDICEGDKGELWLAFLGGGVCNYNPSTGGKKIYTTANGLANNMTYCILKDKTGNIWVSTNTGISRINPGTGNIRSFGLNEGLNIIEFNSGASFACDNGEFLMGGMGGIAGFFPGYINSDELETGDQKVIITEVRVSGKIKQLRYSGGKADTLFLNKGENNVNIHFSSSDFIHSEKARYRYKLTKVSESWVETDSRNRNVSFANLNPGWYAFELQVTDRSGSWAASKEIRIRVRPYFYQTWGFMIAFPLVLLSVIAAMIIIYIRQIKQREAQKQDALRLQSLRGQMNPHFIFNSLNSINYFISNNDKLSANRYIADFSKLIRSILHNLNHDFITLEKEIESVEDYLKIEYLRFGDKFDYNLTVEKEIADYNIKVSPGLIQPFVENAIWHGVRGLEKRKGKIDIWFGTKDRQLTCIIKDDGIGRKKSELQKSKNDQKKSKGITIVMERLRIINGLQGTSCRISITDLYPDQIDTGTIVEIDIPVALG